MSNQRLTRREIQVLKQIVQDHSDSELESGAESGRLVANQILAKLTTINAVMNAAKALSDACKGEVLEVFRGEIGKELATLQKAISGK